MAYLTKWESKDNYVLQDRALNKLFNRTYSKNTDIDDVLVKVCTLNDFYSTNILSPFNVANHIVSLKIDYDLEKANTSVVNKIAKIKISGKEKNFYSFATKYCSHHNPTEYPIYDYYVEKVLMFYMKKDSFSNFNSKDLRDYTKFKEIILDFREFYNLQQFTLKDIDKFLWQYGKENFKRQGYK